MAQKRRDNTRPTVFSTDPIQESRPKEVKLPSNPAAALPTLQRNQPVYVHRDRKGRHGKTVSVIKGVMSPPGGMKALAKYLKNKLGTGGAVKGTDIEIQGDHRAQIVVLLDQLGYRAKIAGG